MAEFHKLATVDEVGPGEIKQYLVEDRFVALCNVEGEFHAFEDVCTHQFTHLSEGEFSDAQVTCPLHGAKHEVKVENGNVYVALNPKRVKVGGRRGRRR